jgi:hypothetical protein
VNITTQPQTLLSITNPYFAKGYLGRLWYFGYEWQGEINDEYLLTNVLSWIERNLQTHPNWLAEHLGFVIGMVSGNLIPEQ